MRKVIRPASSKEVILYALMGEALCAIQHLEECLSTSITLKVDVGHPSKVIKTEAERFLKEHRKRTLGNAIRHAAKNKLYTDDLQKILEMFLGDRNWLVHKCIDDIYASANWEKLFQRLKIVVNKAHQLQHAIEEDLLSFSEDQGLDMSSVRAAVQHYDQAWMQE